MNVLILSGTQACGFGLPDGKSYVGQLVRRLRTDGQAVRVDQYGSLTLPEAGRLLSRLRLYQYDIILLQLGDAELHCPPHLRIDWPSADQLEAVPAEVMPLRHQLKQSGQRTPVSWVRRQLGYLNLRVRGHQTARMRVLRHQLATVLMMVQPYRDRTVLLSPLPQPGHALVQKLVRNLFLAESLLWDVSSCDTAALLEQRELLFQVDNATLLNDLAHELIGSELYTLIAERDQLSSPRQPRWRRPSAS